MSAAPLSLTRPSARATSRATLLTALVALAFAAPATLAVTAGFSPPSEARLGRIVVGGFGGVTLPILAALVVVTFFAAETPTRTRIDRLIAAGLDPRRAAVAPMTMALTIGAIVPAIVAALVVTALRVGFHLGGGAILVEDALGTAWAVALGGAAWTSMALAFGTRAGRGGRAFIVIAPDLATRLFPGGGAWIAPSSHVGNLLGAPPPTSLAHVPILPQWVSVIVLASIAAVFFAIAIARHRRADRS